MSYPLRLPTEAPIITVTHPKKTIWIIELHNGEDSRITHNIINNALMPALDAIEKDWRQGWKEAQKQKGNDGPGGSGALIFVGKRDQDKFFSNGLDFENTTKDRSFFPNTFNPLMARILTFPIPTIAAVNGHCFAAGFIIALTCDYRIMTDGSKRRAWLCMNEVHFGAVWPYSFAALVRAKVGNAQLQRKIVLEGHRFTPQEALKEGIIDYIVNGSTAEIVTKAEELGEAVGLNARTGVWGAIKRDLYRDTLETFPKYVTTADDVAHAKL